MFRAHRHVLPLSPFCALAGIPAVLPSFAATLAGVALLHSHTLPIAVAIPSWVPPPKHHTQAATRAFANTIVQPAIAAPA